VGETHRCIPIKSLEIIVMKMKPALLLLTALLSFTVNAFADPDPNFYIFLCFGQSNMESGGRMEEMDRIVDKRFQVMADFDAPNRGWKKDNWYDAVPPLAAKGRGICIVDSFGRTMVANMPEDIRVGIIKVSVPGCKIELFEKDTYQAYVDTAPDWMKNLVKQYDENPYQYLVDMARVAQKDGVIKGILLHQGESNPNDLEWPNKVKGIYDTMIKDLNLKAEEVPLLAGETVNADQQGACAGFNKIMAELPKTLPNSYVISSAGCTCNPDRMHFNSAGSREFGKRYAEKMLSLLRYKTTETAAPGPATVVAADSVALTVHTDQTTKTISAGIYGQFLEHIFNSVHGGLWGDQILNGALEPRPSSRGRRPGPPPADATAEAPSPASAPASTQNPPRNWEFVGDSDEVTLDRDNPFNAEVSVRLAGKSGSNSTTGPGIRQQNIALKHDEKYTFSLYARGSGSVVATFYDGNLQVFIKTFTGLTGQWQKFTVEFAALSTVEAASILISSPPPGSANVDQVSLFSASALATGGYRPDLFKAIADLQPASIRWPGGSFANKYIWQNGIGPREKRLPHPIDQWGDRDTYQFGTDEFIQFCEKIKAEPILVLNTSRGVDDALGWLEYCMGDATTEYGKMRAANGHPEPYRLNYLEIDNEPWLMMVYSNYLDIVNRFCPAIRAKYPNLKLSVAGSYGYDTGPGEGNQETNRNWDPRIIEAAGKLFDILSPHYYNGIYFTADFVEDPYKYEQFLKGRGEIIRKSANPNMKIYVSEWNLTNNRWGNDWRVGLYAGGILNAFERQADIVTMSCPALFLRKQGVTKDWDNALINFDPKSWFPAGNYIVMKLWRDSFAPNLLVVDGPDHPLNFVATRSADNQVVFLKAVNPTGTAVEAVVRFDGDLIPKTATMQLVAPGGETVKNTLDQPGNIKVTASTATVERDIVKFTLPPLSAGVVRVMP
jgi:alpha-L-arabinofuranosidase